MPEKEPQLPARFHIYLADVVIICQVSNSTASRRINQCRDALGKRDHQVLTIEEFCLYYGYPYLDTLKKLELL